MRFNKQTPSAMQAVAEEAKRAIRPLIWLSAGINVLMLTGSFYIFQVYHRVLGSHSLETLVMLSLMAAGALITMGALEVVRGRLLATVGSWMSARLAPVMLTASVELAATSPGQAGGRALRDLDQVRNFCAKPSVYPILDAPWAPLSFVAIFMMHPWLGWTALIGGAVLFALALLNELVTRKPMAEAANAQTRAHTQSEAAIRNAEVVQAMGMLQPMLAGWQAQQQTNLHQVTASNRATLIASTARAWRSALQMAILGLGAYLVLQNEASPGIMIAASILMGRALAPVEQAISTWKATISARAAYKRLTASFGQRPEAAPVLPLPRPQGRFAAENITLTGRQPGEFILKGISFQLEPGEVMALIGPSAAGETSLARVLAGARRATGGRALFDGMNVAEWAAADKGRHVGYLPQDIELFAGTVAENIARFASLNPVVFDNVVKAAQRAGVHELIKSLPQGYSTDIGDAGAVLSGGQRQRIGLARALYGNPALLILDEPNSNLDHEGDVALADAIKTAKAAGTTIIMIAHRPNIMEQVDKVLVINRGQQDMFGPRDVVFNELANRTRKVAQMPTIAVNNA